MARPLRLQFPGAVSHVISRGHERGAIFRTDRDRKKWLDLVDTIAAEEGWEIHAYCLMTNHYHLLIETPRGHLSRGVRSLNGRYAQWFNDRNDRRGHLFEGRYKAVLVQKSSHLLELARYVVLNPVRAGIVSRPADWRWSSYRATAGLAEAPPWLNVDWTLGQFARSRAMARVAYRKFVAEGKGKRSPLGEVRGQIYLGDESFLKEMKRLLESQRVGDQIPAVQRRLSTPSIEAIKAAVAREWRVPPEQLSRRRGGVDKMAAIYVTRKLAGRPGREIADAFGIKPARVSNVIRQVEEGEDSALRSKIDRVIGRLR